MLTESSSKKIEFVTHLQLKVVRMGDFGCIIHCAIFDTWNSFVCLFALSFGRDCCYFFRFVSFRSSFLFRTSESEECSYFVYVCAAFPFTNAVWISKWNVMQKAPCRMKESLPFRAKLCLYTIHTLLKFTSPPSDFICHSSIEAIFVVVTHPNCVRSARFSL